MFINIKKMNFFLTKKKLFIINIYFYYKYFYIIIINIQLSN